MNNRRYTLIGLIFLVVMTIITTLLLSGVGSLLITGRSSGYTAEELVFFKKFVSAKDLLKKEYYNNITDKEIYDGAMSGMFESLNDPYAAYLSNDENKALEEFTEGKYDGLGIYLSMDFNDGTATIISVIENTPAEVAGLLAGDKIVKVNGTEVKGENLEKIVELMKLPAGSEVNLSIKRENEIIDKKIVTGEVSIKTVYSEKIEEYGYIEILTFSEHTAKEFNEKYTELMNENIKGLIIDVRGNSGGLYDSAIKIAETIVPKGLIVYTENKDGVKEEKKSTGEGIQIPLVMLIDEESASASEILAGAVKDRNCGTLVGKKTFGKGLVQGWYLIGDGTSVKMTIAKYFTPNGICIDGLGIEPNIEVDLGEGYTDLQLKKAIEILKK